MSDDKPHNTICCIDDKNYKNNNEDGHKSLINPYELLGIDINKKDLSIKEVKKAYYSMALVCHPDKGGTENDMNVVQQAYSFICNQMENNIVLTDEVYANLENNFNTFLQNQEQKVPDFADIYNNVRDFNSNFNKKFEKVREREVEEGNTFGLATHYYGYGNIMEQSDNKYTDLKNLDYDKLVADYQRGFQKPEVPAPKVDVDFFKRGKSVINNHELVVPEVSLGQQTQLDLEINSQSSSILPRNETELQYQSEKGMMASNNTNLNIIRRPVLATDYKEAHQHPDMIDLTLYKESKTPIDKLYELKQKDRKNMDEINFKLFKKSKVIELDKYRKKRNIIDKELARSYILTNVPMQMNVVFENRHNEKNIDRAREVKREIRKQKADDDFVLIDKEDIIRGKIEG